LKLAREIIQGLQFEQKLPDPALKQAVLANILNGSSKDINRLYDVKNSLKNEPYRASFWTRVGQFSKVAAILVLALALSVTVNYLHKAPPKPAAVALIKTVNKATAYGEKLNFRLP